LVSHPLDAFQLKGLLERPDGYRNGYYRSEQGRTQRDDVPEMLRPRSALARPLCRPPATIWRVAAVGAINFAAGCAE
jgi:hypothetical protein